MVMTSATWPENVRRLARGYMSKPVTVFIGSLDLAAVHSVSQKILKCWNDDKWPKLLEFLEDLKSDEKVIVFVMRKTRADFISAELAMKGIVAQCIHGGRDQDDREQAKMIEIPDSIKMLKYYQFSRCHIPTHSRTFIPVFVVMHCKVEM